MGIAQDIVALFQKRVQEHGSAYSVAKCLGFNKDSFLHWTRGKYFKSIVFHSIDIAGGKLKIGEPTEVGTFNNAILTMFQRCLAKYGGNYSQTARVLELRDDSFRKMLTSGNSLLGSFFAAVDKCGGYLEFSGTDNLPDPEVPKRKVLSKPKIQKHKVSKLATKPKVVAKEESPSKLVILSQLRDEYLAANGKPSWLKKPSRRAKQRIETEIDPDWDSQNERIEWNF